MKWMMVALVLLLSLPVKAETARLVAVKRAKSAKSKKKSTKPAPAVSRAQMELAEQMVRNAYGLGRGLEPRQRVALMTRLLYTMRPEVMAAEKKQWAEELFGLAQQLPRNEGNEAVEVDSARNAAIATAAARLAVYDADRALELLDSLPLQHGNQADAREMASRLVFAGYMQRHGAAGAQTLLAHGQRWSAQGGFPYGASAAALGKLRPNEDAAEDFFRQVLVIFERGQDGLYGVNDFASLLHQAVAMEAIFEDSAEAAGRSIVGQLRKLTANYASENQDIAGNQDIALTAEQKGLVVEALNNVRISAPKAYEEGRKTAPALFAVRMERMAVRVEIPKVDLGLQSAFRDLAAAMRAGRKPDELHEVIARGLQLVNAKYKAGACAACASPDAQSWALVSLAALAAPATIETQLNGIEDPFWRAYFLAIAGQQVGQPTRVADPTARRVAGKEEAEPE
jgi:hypothetical protein